jgi:hypothetical protein
MELVRLEQPVSVRRGWARTLPRQPTGAHMELQVSSASEWINVGGWPKKARWPGSIHALAAV